MGTPGGPSRGVLGRSSSAVSVSSSLWGRLLPWYTSGRGASAASRDGSIASRTRARSRNFRAHPAHRNTSNAAIVTLRPVQAPHPMHLWNHPSTGLRVPSWYRTLAPRGASCGSARSTSNASAGRRPPIDSAAALSSEFVRACRARPCLRSVAVLGVDACGASPAWDAEGDADRRAPAGSACRTQRASFEAGGAGDDASHASRGDDVDASIARWRLIAPPRRAASSSERVIGRPARRGVRASSGDPTDGISRLEHARHEKAQSDRLATCRFESRGDKWRSAHAGVRTDSGFGTRPARESKTPRPRSPRARPGSRRALRVQVPSEIVASASRLRPGGFGFSRWRPRSTSSRASP